MKFDDLIGIPFKHKGRSPGAGFDCWGLVLEIYRRCGQELIDPVPDYDEDWNEKKCNNLFLENYHMQWRRLGDSEKPHTFDLVLFGSDPAFPTHMGVLVEKHKVLHCNRGHGVILTRLSGLNGAQGCYRLKEPTLSLTGG